MFKADTQNDLNTVNVYVYGCNPTGRLRHTFGGMRHIRSTDNIVKSCNATVAHTWLFM